GEQKTEKAENGPPSSVPGSGRQAGGPEPTRLPTVGPAVPVSVHREQRDGHPCTVVTLGGPHGGVEDELGVQLRRTAPSVRVGRGQAGRRGQAGAAVERGDRGVPGADTGARGQDPRDPAEVVRSEERRVGKGRRGG